MKLTFLLVSFLSITFFSCHKSNCSDPTPTSINGKWKMIIVKDNASGILSLKPPSIPGDVIITFTTANSTTGTYFGNTPSNSISASNFSLGTNQSLSVDNLSMTKAGETPWGNEFVNHIRDSREYSLETNGRLNIKTSQKTLTFRKV